MDNVNNQSEQDSVDIKPIDEFDKTMNVAELNLINKQQKLNELEEFLIQKERFLAQKERELKDSKEIIFKKEIELNDKDARLGDLELQAKNGFPKIFEERFIVFKKQLDQREAECINELESIETEKVKLRQRELMIKKSEIQRDNGYVEDRAKLDEELFNLRKRQEKELESKRVNTLDFNEKEFSEQRKSRILQLDNEIADRLKNHEILLQKEKDELQYKREAFLNDQADLDELKDNLAYEKQRLQSRKDALEDRETNLSVEIDAKIAQRKQSFENERSALNDEINRLRESIKTSSTLISSFEELKRKLGDEDPAVVLRNLKAYEEDINELREELATRPTRAIQEAFDRLISDKEHIEREKNKYKDDYEALYKAQQPIEELESQNDTLKRNNKTLVDQRDNIEAHNNQLQADIKRLQSTYEREADREARIGDIEEPYITKLLPIDTKQIDELQWLDSISQSCLNYGLRFPRRILHAFHTALKTSEWSPITVLAGVSGTGKSELPRLYSHFGGISFLSLSVQPNWDSPESMLGFFNSMDNKFDAQPALRLLAQTQKPQTEDYPFGLEDTMSLILMDEMNLAHVELYFAEFLSKLELRRGRRGNEVPNLEVKLGAGIQHYDLPLGRNVLWAGTMNQDETTKSLSDKVLDRGIVINFPRPTTLERRSKLKPLGKQAPLLSRKVWESWWCRESTFNDEQILPFKRFIEEMNTSLSKVGRALGHRVWQSIEYYMANYPDVLEAQRNKDEVGLEKAMKIAFEDQLVQKVMPKLRGIETRGKSKTECLDKIRNQLVNEEYTIIDDFDLACEFGYGQFIWSSANYLNDDELINVQEDIDFIELDSSSEDEAESSFSHTIEELIEQLPGKLIDMAKSQSKQLWQLSMIDIKNIMDCDVREAQQLKAQCNKTKES